MIGRLFGVLAIFAAGLFLGWYATSGHYEGQRARAERQAQALREQDEAQGRRIAEQLREQLAERSRFTHTLQEKLSHAQLAFVPACRDRGAAFAAGAAPAGTAALVRPAAAGAGAAGGSGPAGAGVAAAEPGAGGVPGGDVAAGPGAAVAGGEVAAPGVRLTLAAVSLWNSALAGDHVPAGPCGADGSAPGACAADSGLGLEAAWHNHAINAATCAEDRARHQRLIDYLRTREARP